NELNSLTVGGCGTGTHLSHIQMHRGQDDGVEFFGGTASIDHFIVSGPGDDGLDWDQGWRGSATKFIVHSFAPTGSGFNGIEADNFKDSPDVQPRSNPTVSYGTLIGVSTTDDGMLLRRGTGGNIQHCIATGWAAGGDIDGTATAAI